jgi:2-polyprenyl-3-methyl-5-hydroxy-6-metoxy-1,4-benzoquinol methylase
VDGLRRSGYTQPMRPVQTCPVCSGSSLQPFSMLPWHPTYLHLAQARCTGCGLLVAQPQATEEELTAYYSSHYYEGHSLDSETHWRLNCRDYVRYELPLMERLWARSPPPPGARVGEIGCGRGSLLTVLGERGYRVRGAELSTSAVAFCRSKGLDVIEGVDLGPDSSLDVVASFQVIEHVIDPRAFVRRLVSQVRPGGLVVISTENAWTSQATFGRALSLLTGRIPTFRTSSEHTFVFQGKHLVRLLQEEGCDTAEASAYRREPATGSLHLRLYREAFRLVDRLAHSEEYLMAVGRRSP